jgi:2-polyprenyl-3-methyl-5-hydroxy-6-metoxy-1,4-benzoquinol methylase
MKIINYLTSSFSGKKANILDVGCSKGFIGKALRKSGFIFYGIEIDKGDIKIASKYYKNIKAADLDTDQITYKKNFFDVMIISDVIEHLKKPEVVSKLIPFLKKDGVIILATGNIANLYIRLRLLFGKFDYEDRGILDKTHLKLYTMKTFRQYTYDLGLNIINEEYTPIPLPLVHTIFSEGMPLNIVHKISYLFTYFIPTVFCFEFILYCKKK